MGPARITGQLTQTQPGWRFAGSASVSNTEFGSYTLGVATGPIEASEREVTVLFVDIRGYTGFSETRQAEEVFRTVNRYTETVSQLVQGRGGTVVEFHGDGLLAVFGAPDALEMMEQAAVMVGCEIIAAIATCDIIGDQSQTLSVGGGSVPDGVRRQHPSSDRLI
jgi:class 3 adenylate cyclase